MGFQGAKQATPFRQPWKQRAEVPADQQ
jgi:hypothetical protein